MSDLYHGPSLRNEMVKWLDSENDYSIYWYFFLKLLFYWVHKPCRPNSCVEFISRHYLKHTQTVHVRCLVPKTSQYRNTTNIYIYIVNLWQTSSFRKMNFPSKRHSLSLVPHLWPATPTTVFQHDSIGLEQCSRSVQEGHTNTSCRHHLRW